MNKTAIVVVDMLKDFTTPEGKVFYKENRNIIPKINKLVKKARENKELIIYLQHFNRQNKFDEKASKMRENCIEGTVGDELDDSLDYNPKTDYLIKKRRYSGFFGTDLDLVLRENDIKNVIIVGTKTNCCIRATVTDAFYLNYNPIVIEDCVATNSKVVNDVHLEDIRKYFGKVISLEDYIQGERE